MSVRYLLDTNICIYIAKHNPPVVREHFARHAANELRCRSSRWANCASALRRASRRETGDGDHPAARKG